MRGYHSFRQEHPIVGPIAVYGLPGLIEVGIYRHKPNLVLKRAHDAGINQAEVKKTMIDISSGVILVFDICKIRSNCFVRRRSSHSANRLSTDNRITMDKAGEFEKIT